MSLKPLTQKRYDRVLKGIGKRLDAKLPEQEREHAMPLTENHWKRIRKAVLAAYAA